MFASKSCNGVVRGFILAVTILVMQALLVALRAGTAADAMTVLRQECVLCHSPEKKKGGLLLTSREFLNAGGSSGPVVQTQKPESSLLLRVLEPGADPHMPPKKQLDPKDIRILRKWVLSGFPWDQQAFDGEESPRTVALGPLPPEFHPALAVAVSPDGSRLAAGHGRSLLLFDVQGTNFSFVQRREVASAMIQSLAWSPDGRSIFVGDFRKIHRIDGSLNGTPLLITDGLTGSINALKAEARLNRLFAADGASGAAGRIREFDLADCKPAGSWKAHQDQIYCIDISADGKRIATAGADRLVKVWDSSTHKEIATLEGHTAQVLAVAFNTNGTQVASGAADKQIKVFDIQTREKLVSLGGGSANVSTLKWAADGSALFSGLESGGAFRYTDLKAHSGEQSSATAQEKQIGSAAGDSILCLDIDPQARRVFAGTQSGEIMAWDKEGKLLGRFKPAPDGEPLPGRSPNLQSSSQLKLKVQPSKAVHSAERKPLPKATIQSVAIWPSSIRLSPSRPSQKLIITARTSDGFELDVTDEASLAIDSAARGIRLEKNEVSFQGKAAEAKLTARFRGKAVSCNVESNPNVASSPASFVLDVLPVLSKAGCNAGGCHAKGDGQNGFKLSVFSYDPASDHAEILKEARGRRIFPSAPDESLLLLKPTGRLSHEGGVRLTPGSADYDLVSRWIGEGASFGKTNEAKLVRIEVFPARGIYHKQAIQRLGVLAHYSDGSQRDVTRLASFDSNDKEIARMHGESLFETGTLPGQAVIVARYMGYVGDSQIMVPADSLLPPERYAGLKINNFIDSQAYAHFQKLGLFPSDVCTDAEFVRRSKLDAIGLLPTAEEVRRFLSDPSPDKRAKWIDQLLNDPAYADYWANKWADLVRPNPDRVGVKSVFTLDQWLREAFKKNLPYDEFSRAILLTKGNNHREGPAVIYRDRREPSELTTLFSQLFLGVRMECAKCHHHPNEKWSQDDFYQFAAFFGPLKQKGAGLSPPISAGTESFYFAPGGTVKHPVTGEIMKPRPLDSPFPEIASNRDPREVLADWLTSSDNPYFARAAVNRVWATFFGRGMVEPVDDFRISNPCVNPALLDALAAEFSAQHYDIKRLIRLIMNSNLYQLSSTPNSSNLADTRNFSRAYRRRLPAEVLLDAVTDVTGIPDTLNGVPQGGRAVQAWSYKIESQFMDAFGRPNSSSDCPCERDRQLSVVQSLHLMNSKPLQAKLADEKGRVHKLARSALTPAEIVEELYLATLSRFPTQAEKQAAERAFSAPEATRLTASEDVIWALINSPEFILNH